MTLVGVVVLSGCVPADDTDRPSTPVTAPVVSPDRARVPTPTPVQPRPDVAPTWRPPSALPVAPLGGTSTVEREVAPAMSASVPVRLRIPSAGVDSTLVDLGLQSDGAMEVPASGFPAGWYTGAPTPGELGPAIIAGHVDWGGQPGVFFELRDLSPGDEIAITRRDGSTAHFRVDRLEQFDKGDFPTRAVYGDLDHAGLRLITCGGDFDHQERRYDDNLVVFAELV